MHLRDTAQGVCILHASAGAVRFANLAAFEHLAQVRRCLHLSVVRARFMDALIEGRVSAFESVTAKAAQHVGRIHQRLGRQKRQCAHGQHALRPVDERNGFFGFEHQRLDLCLLQRVGAGNALARWIETLALADHRQRQMRQRSQISACSYAALRGHERSHAAIQHFAQRVDNNSAHA
jgi:hypothetical protein